MTGAGPLQGVRRLLALEEIRQLAVSYAFAFDVLDWNLMFSLWVDTELPEPSPILDIHAMRRLPAKYEDAGASMLLVANHRVEFHGEDHASGSVYCFAMADRGHFFEQAIVYLDDYERHGGRWLFRRRSHLLRWGRTVTNPMEQPQAHWPRSQVGRGTASEELRARP